MQIKKNIGSFTIIINMNGYETNIQHYDILLDIFGSFENAIILNNNIKADVLMQLNQSGNSTILTTEEPKKFDELRILLKLISNFFIYTNQVQFFNIEYIEKQMNDDSIIAFGSEIYNGDLKKLIFSPSLRAKWKNPQFINNLINLF